MKSVLLSASLLAFVSFTTKAQNQLDCIIIQESKLQIPYHQNSSDIQILSRKDIDALPVKSVNELLA